MRNYIILAIGILFSFNTIAQRPGGGQRDFSNMPAEGVVSGIVLEQGTEVPMEYANVVLYSMRDSSIIAGTVTDEKGRFKLEKVRYGRMYAITNFIGYEKTYTNNIKVTPKARVVDLGTIYLKPASTTIEGVEVVADKAHVEFKIDKKIVNVSQDIMAQGSSAVEVLENTPSVQVDIEGNVTMRGTSNFNVLIDGRPSVLKGSDALQQIPASSIDHIEIITNPSAKYDPDGVGGIINVVLKKQKSPGVNGVINASIASGNKYKFDALLNYRSKSFNVFGGVDVNYREFSMEGHSEYETYFDDTTNFRDSEREGKMNREGFGLKAGMDYFLTDKSTITLSGRYGGYGFGRDFTSTTALYSLPELRDEFTKSESESSRDGRYYRVNLNYVTKFDNNGHKLELLGYYSNKTGDDWEEQFDYETDEEWLSIDEFPITIKTTEDEVSNDYRVKADYTKPMGEEGKFEAGYQSRLNSETEKYIFEDFDHDLGEWVENDLYTSEVDFKRNIHSVYSTYSNTWGSWGYQAGLRGEYTDREIKNVMSTDEYVIDRFDYFPSIHLSKQFEGDHQVLASYSRRIDRPRGRELDPFLNYWDEYNVRQGNPGLEPEYIDSYELGYQKRINKSFISFETYYRINKNKITRIKTLQDDGVILHTYQNLNKDFALGMELMINADIAKWFNLNGSVNVFDYRLEGNVENEDVSVSSTNWNGRINATFKIRSDFRAQYTGFYRGPSVTAQGTREGYFVSNIAVRKDFFDRKFNATLSVRDVFATAVREYTTEGNGFYSYDYFQREAPIISLNLSYMINNYKKERDKGRNGDENGNGDMEMDMEM